MSPASNTTAQRAKRLYLLDAAEVAALYDRPVFTDEERAYYFSLTPAETTLMQTFTDGAVQAFFVLQLGYFKAKRRSSEEPPTLAIVRTHRLRPRKLKRLARESFRHQPALPPWDFVVLARAGADRAERRALRASLDRHFEQLTKSAAAGQHE